VTTRAAGVESEPTDLDRTFRVLRSRPTEHGPVAGVEPLGGVRLDHVVVGAGVEGADDLPFVVTGGGHDDRDGAHRTQHPQQFEPVDVGQS